MNSVSVQIQSAINDAISSQVSPQIQNAIMAGSGHMTQKGWNVQAEGPETNTEVLRKEKAKNKLKSELVHNRLNDGITDNANDKTKSHLWIMALVWCCEVVYFHCIRAERKRM